MSALIHPVGLLKEQIDLFGDDGPEISIDASFRTAKRVDLDERSWIEIVPGWVSGSLALFDHMHSTVPWAEHERRMYTKLIREPRLTATYKDVEKTSEESLKQALHALSRRYGVPYDSVWMNLYRGGADSTAWHRDRHSSRKPECVVPVLTLGASRRFMIKPLIGGRSMTFVPSSGDLIVMGGRAQEDWVHCVPKESKIVGARISVNFQSRAQSE
jgi:alkylated DNA repair dioxygenase AlkB